MVLTLNRPQTKFFNLNKPFRAYVAGYRGGKTFAGCTRLATLSLEFPGIKLGYFAPTYPLIADIFYPTIEDVCDRLGLRANILVSNKEVQIFRGRSLLSTVKCRSMEHPYRIIGFDISHALVDEIDCMPRKKADQAWKKIIARLSATRSDYPVNTADFTTTPEGYNFIYDLFVSQLNSSPELQEYYGIIHASTEENYINLPADYIPKLYATYPPNLVKAYVDGQFVNLTTGSVYPDFDRVLNHTDAKILPGETLHLGIDFNIGINATVVNVYRQGKLMALDEIGGCRDTPALIREIKQRFVGHPVICYPDASGQYARSTINASESDVSLLRQAGFEIRAHASNPPVRDRINAVNGQILNADGDRRYLVNTHKCLKLTESLERQPYAENGEPDKNNWYNHWNDSAGYPIAYLFPIRKVVGTTVSSARWG